MTIAPPPEPADEDLDAFRADRVYLGADHRRNERRTWIVTVICAATLAVMVGGGVLSRSVALTASGLHMAAHVAALLVASGAYALARRHARNPAFAFGTGKLGDLAGFANAMVLAVTAILIAVESVDRLIHPAPVDYAAALPLAVGGLVITTVCMLLLKPRGQSGDDLNLDAAHLHLTGDAAVAALAILALLAGRWLGWTWADAVAGLAGAVLVGHFAVTLIRRAARTLLDINPSAELTAEVRQRLEAGGGRVEDLHLWRLGPGHHALIAVIGGDHPESADAYRARLRGIPGLSHVTIEVGRGHSHSHG